MNVAIFTDTYPPFVNGVSTSCYNLANVFKKHGHNVLIVAPRTSDGPLEYKDGIISMPGIQAKNFYGYRLTKFFDRRAFNMIKEFKPDVIHNQTDVAVGVFARKVAKKLKCPLVYTYHTNYEDYTYIVTHGVLDRAAKKVVRLYSNGIANNATEFITPSDKTKNFMRQTGSDKYINCIPTGIDFSLFSDENFDQEKAKAFKQEHNIDPDTKIILVLGRLAKEKSVDVSLSNYAAFLKAYPEIKIKMLIVGDGPGRRELELLSHELHISQNVEFLGSVPASEVSFYYHLADVYTSASTTETQGLTFMEAMSSGTIVFARYDDNLCGTIIDNQTGFFFTDEASSVEKLYRIFNLTKEEKDKIKDNAYKIVDIYSVERFYESILGVYNRAIKKCW